MALETNETLIKIMYILENKTIEKLTIDCDGLNIHFTNGSLLSSFPGNECTHYEFFEDSNDSKPAIEFILNAEGDIADRLYIS